MTDQRTVVVSGATRGLGRALVKLLVSLGHTVIGCGRSQSKVLELSREPGNPHRFDPVDVSDWSQVEKWSADVVQQFGPPDLLVNNAGIINRNAALWEVSEDEFSAVMAVNVNGTANVIRGFVPAMIDRGGGIIVNMSSGWGRSTSPEVAPYCASKWAVEGLTRALSQELPPGLAAVAVNPGVIDTELLRSCWGDGAASLPTPEIWAERAVPFLLDLSVSDNGKSLSVS